MRATGRFVGLMLLLLTIDEPARAQTAPLAGQDDPAFGSALDLWLAGDDAGSLPALAGLAGDGNLAAQVLLDRIRTRGLAATPWVDALPDAEKRALFRMPGQGLGTVWIRVAAESSPLAQHFATFMVPTDTGYAADGALELARRGEARAGAQLLLLLLGQWQWDEVLRLAPVAGEAGLLPLVWAAATHAPDAPGAAALAASGHAAAAAGGFEGLLFLRHADPGALPADRPADDVLRYLVDGTPPAAGMGPPTPEAGALFASWLEAAPAAAFLRGYCGARCPDAVAACGEDVYGALTGYVALAEFQQSPLETVLSTERFLASPRAGIALDARVKAVLGERYGGGWAAEVELEACLRGHLDRL